MNGKRDRILALDLLRGLFLLIIIVDHLSLFPNVFEIFSGRGHLWSSAAEGFFLISGTLVGFIYGPRMSVAPIRTAQKIWKRALELYCYSIATTFIFQWWGNAAVHGAKPGLWIHPPTQEFIVKVLTLRFVYGWADFLTHYVMYMIFAPFVVYLISKRKGWVVAAVSVGIWLQRGLHMDLAWQILFVIGIGFGYYLPFLEQKVHVLSTQWRVWGMRVLFSTSLVCYAASELVIRVPAYFDDRHITSGRFYDLTRVFVDFHNRTLSIFDKNTLGPGRLVISILWFASLYVYFRQHEQRIHTVSRGVLRSFGRVSLFVYVVHAFVIFALHLVLPTSTGFIVNTIITAWTAALIYEFIHYRDRLINTYQKIMMTTRPQMPQNSSFVYVSQD